MRKAQSLEREVRERWPILRQLIVCYFHQDWVHRSQTIENVVGEMTETEALDKRKVAVTEWWDANGEVAWKNDFRTVLIDGFGFEQDFPDAAEARAVWNRIYDAMIAGIRKEDKGWKP